MWKWIRAVQRMNDIRTPAGLHVEFPESATYREDFRELIKVFLAGVELSKANHGM